jgi:CRP-like cAMP-binding protein
LLRTNAKIELLRGLPLFSACSKRQLGEIAKIANEVDFASGETLIREGDPPSRFFVLVDGGVEVTKGGETVEILGGAEFFGEMSVLTSSPTNATVTATSSGRALVVTGDDLRRLMHQSPEIEEKVIHSLEERLEPEMLSRLTFWLGEGG